MIHSGAMTLCKFRMLTRWYRGGSSSCSLNNIPLVPKLRLPSLRRQFVGFPRCTCDVVTTFHCFVRSAILLRALSIVCVFLTSLHNLRNSHQVPSGNDASRFDDLGLLDCGALSDFLSRPTTANRFSESSRALLFVSTFLVLLLVAPAELLNMCRRTFLLRCVFFTRKTFVLNHFVDGHEL